MIKKWIIKDSDGNITNPSILADEEFVKNNFTHYEALVPPTPPVPTVSEIARRWRNGELKSTDNIAQTPDFPNRDKYLTYRQALRDWPSTADFPDKKPTLG